MEYIARLHYVEAAQSWLQQGMIVILTGQRRVGKSCVLRQLGDTLTAAGRNVVLIDKEDMAFDHIRTYQHLHRYAEEHAVTNRPNCLLVDEVQEIEEYEKSVRSLSANGWQVALTGSNAHILSSEIGTLLGGRYVEIHIHSLSYTEFLTFHDLTPSENALRDYLLYGGLPHLRRIGLNHPDMLKDYLQSLYHSILLKDVVTRENIRNIAFLQNLVAFLADNIGKLISANSISRFMKQETPGITSNLVINYLRFLCNAYVLNAVPRYEIHGRRLLESNEKYYFEDLGLRNALCRAGAMDIEKRIENAVYLHLRSCGYTVYVGQLQSAEIDFVATRGSETIYVQAAYMIASAETEAREFGNLLRIKDNQPKYVVSVTPMADFGRRPDGIIHLRLSDFLLSESF